MKYQGVQRKIGIVSKYQNSVSAVCLYGDPGFPLWTSKHTCRCHILLPLASASKAKCTIHDCKMNVLPQQCAPDFVFPFFYCIIYRQLDEGKTEHAVLQVLGNKTSEIKYKCLLVTLMLDDIIYRITSDCLSACPFYTFESG